MQNQRALAVMQAKRSLHSQWFIWAALFFGVDCKGQSSAPVAAIRLEETGIWNGLYLKGRFSNKVGYYGEHHYRERNRPEQVAPSSGAPAKSTTAQASISFSTPTLKL